MSKERQGANARRSKIAIARALLFFFVFLGLEILVDHRHDLDSETSCDVVQPDDIPWKYETIYPWLTSRLLGKEPSGRVIVIYIPEKLVAVQQNVCYGRSYLAALLKEVSRQGPKAIVLDKYFSKDFCTSDDEKKESAALIQAVEQAGVPVIVGQATGTASSPKESTSPPKQSTCLTSDTTYQLFHSPNVQYGLTKLNVNREQIPLQWLTFNASAPRQMERLDSLALATLKIVAPEQTETSQLQISLKKRQPYARLDLSIPATSSEDLVCTSGAGNCGLTTPNTSNPASGQGARNPPHIAGKVVIIASQNRVDRWLVLGKHRWGYELQAAYVDALLSGKYLSALPRSWIFQLSILFLFFLEAVPALAQYLYYERKQRVWLLFRRSEVWLWVWSGLVIALLLVFCKRLHYLPPLTLVLGTCVTVAVRAIFNGMDYFQKQSVPHRKEL